MVIEEPESAALAAHLEEFGPVLATSRLAHGR
jgi:hypothetical protein